MTASRVAVVGGGIAGLVAARGLLHAGVEVAVLEADTRLGGKILGGTIANVPIELGADAFLARDSEPLELCDELGLTSSLVSPAVFGALVWTERGLKRLPPNVMGIPMSAHEARRTGIISPASALRALAGDRLSRRLTGPDLSVAEFVTARFGRAVLDAMVDPLLAGTRAGDPRSMSLAAAMPEVDAAARSGGAIARALRHRPSAPIFYSLVGGVSRLVSALAEELEGRIRTSARVTSLSRADGGYRLEVESADPVSADAVILAVPAFAATSMLRSLDRRVAQTLDRIRFASVAVIALAYERGSFDLPEGVSGLLVPSSRGRVLSACTFYARKWANVLPDDSTEIVRCFVGRTDRDEGPRLGDDRLVEAVVADLQAAFGTSARPEASLTHRWDRGLAQLEVGHLDLIAQIDRSLENTGLALAGTGYRGTGIPDCIRHGKTAARRVLSGL